MSFNSIIGHNDIKSKLEGSIFENRVGHAYVFTGAQGVGKKTTAIAYSQLLLCNETCKNTSRITSYNVCYTKLLRYAYGAFRRLNYRKIWICPSLKGLTCHTFTTWFRISIVNIYLSSVFTSLIAQ